MNVAHQDRPQRKKKCVRENQPQKKKGVRVDRSQKKEDNNEEVIPSIDSYPLKPVYAEVRKISVAKKRDLTNLLKKEVIPSAYSHFYKSLPISSKVRDYCLYNNLSDDEDDVETVELELTDDEIG